MLDILQEFLAFYGYSTFRLDGNTPIDRRQYLMDRFNEDPSIFCFILSTRSGGVGMNLTGANVVIFYDSDWNPAMDLQAQDRCHRIGQTRDVRIYRLITQNSIEERILQKSREKMAINRRVIADGGFNLDFFKKLNVKDFFSRSGSKQESYLSTLERENVDVENMSQRDLERMMSSNEDRDDVTALRKARFEELSQTEDEITRFERVENSLKPIQKFGISYVEKANSLLFSYQVAAMESEETRKSEMWKTKMNEMQRQRALSQTDKHPPPSEIHFQNQYKVYSAFQVELLCNFIW
eukprot:CAMPEP_0117431254 /NCGR_PEP_ID=MMETSP0758-20121206/10796_1 /TAXON_ID=63605 /ORGANISM="Percolomonas cosmopolitus, Strain AE-1 (ATCC 50343)" /LENGTH=294 /DNA_ID=CAMNT_0005220095 /DNA_START=1429 /DNA_END=2310 /DNA_ORIENTATION=+